MGSDENQFMILPDFDVMKNFEFYHPHNNIKVIFPNPGTTI